ncbi:hypothetical protein KRIGEM_01748 [Komagataeibacter rhaeticus]|nr:hypothetical protein KRIGEM_01748 [Komagataeibacter rhaeticus]
MAAGMVHAAFGRGREAAINCGGLTAAVQAATVAPFDSTGRIACSAASNVR